MIEFDKKTEEWFDNNKRGQVTLWKCDDCGLYYSKELGHDCEKKGKWEPKYNDEYWYIEADGGISDTYYTCHWDKARRSVGNCFKTEEEAKFNLERLKVLAEMRAIADKDKQPEWDGNNKHYYLYYHHRNDLMGVAYNFDMKGRSLYFATQERAKECLETIGEDRIKKYYLGVD